MEFAISPMLLLGVAKRKLGKFALILLLPILALYVTWFLVLMPVTAIALVVALIQMLWEEF